MQEQQAAWCGLDCEDCFRSQLFVGEPVLEGGRLDLLFWLAADGNRADAHPRNIQSGEFSVGGQLLDSGFARYCVAVSSHVVVRTRLVD